MLFNLVGLHRVYMGFAGFGQGFDWLYKSFRCLRIGFTKICKGFHEV